MTERNALLGRIKALAESHADRTLSAALDEIDPAALDHVDVAREVLVLESGKAEWETIRSLLVRVEEAERSIRRVDPSNVLVSPRAFDAAPRFDTASKLRMLRELRTHAYGKLVVLKPVGAGPVIKRRIAQANYGFPDIGVLSRLAPVAQEIVSAEVGEEVTLPTGQYEVIAIAHLERHVGNELTSDSDNFKRMGLTHVELLDEAVLEDLKRALHLGIEELVHWITDDGRDCRRPLVREEEVREIRRGDEEQLAANFYTRTTKLQERLMRSEEGLTIVLGVAGSGKTSVALGRTKVLCDRIPEEGEARFFNPETAVGFVLSAQLCGYLKRTCQQLALGDMQVQEYQQLRNDLLRLRRFDDEGLTKEVDGTSHAIEGSMAWLHAADRALAERLALEVRDAVQEIPAERERLGIARRTPRRTTEQQQALEELWAKFRRDLEGAIAPLEEDAADRPFRLLGLASSIDGARARFAADLESRPSWRGAGNRDLRQNLRSAVRERIVRAVRLAHAYAAVVGDGTLARELPHELDAQAALDAATARSASKKLSDADLDTLLALAHLVSVGYRGREDRDPISHLTEPPWFTQVFIDEFQDFSEVQLFLMGAQASPDRRTVTVVGDPKQKLYSARPVSLRPAFPWATPNELRPEMLLENKRQAPALALFSQRFREDVLGDRPDVALDLRSDGELPRVLDASQDDLASVVYDEVVRIPRHKSVAVICPDERLAADLERQLREPLGSEFRDTRHSSRSDLLARYYVHFTTPLDAKGLEFDATIVPAFERFDLRDPTQAHACYVAITRPRSVLSLIASGGLDDSAWQLVLKDGLVTRSPVGTSDEPPENVPGE